MAFNAAYALVMMEQAEPVRVLPVLTKGLAVFEWNQDIPYRAAKALGRLGASAKSAIPALAGVSRSSSEWVRDASQEAIRAVNAVEPLGAR